MPKTKINKKKLVIIDSNALIHRAFHALPPLTDKEGNMTNAVYGFTTILLKTIKDLQPDYLAATFDRKEKTFRHKEFEEYKGKVVKVNIKNNGFTKGVLVSLDEDFITVRGSHSERQIAVSEIRDIRCEYNEEVNYD